MRVKREVGKKQSVFINSQPASEVINLKQLRNSVNVFVPEDGHFPYRDRKQLAETRVASNSCSMPGFSRGFIGCKQVCYCVEG
jgi:hypothetical protein